MKLKYLISFLISNLFLTNLFSQTNTDPIIPVEQNEPKTPTTSSLLKYLDFGELSNNGSPNISIPLYEIKSKELSLPISIGYNATGIKVSDVAGNVGLNWNLIAGGLISRSVVDKPDNGTYFTDVYPALTNTFSYIGNYSDFCKHK